MKNQTTTCEYIGNYQTCSKIATQTGRFGNVFCQYHADITSKTCVYCNHYFENGVDPINLNCQSCAYKVPTAKNIKKQPYHW